VDHQVAIPQVASATESVALGHSAAQRVVGIPGGLADAVAAGGRFHQLVVSIPFQFDHFLVARFLVAPGATGHVAVCVVFKVQVLIKAQPVVKHSFARLQDWRRSLTANYH